VAELVARFRVEITNPKAARALGVAVGFLEGMLETFPDRPDVRRACKAARYAARHLAVSAAEQGGAG
jgi:hypothetical protein